MYDSGVQCTITPHSSSNQIFVVVDMSVGLSNGTDAYDGITVCTMTLMEVSS